MRRTIISVVSLLALSVSAAMAGEAEVTFKEPEKYTDIRPANDSRARFQERVLTKFEGFFKELAATLPEGYKWQVTVTDIDLAGDVDYFAAGAGQAIRIVKDIYSPAIRFNYTLTDATGKEVAAGEERLRDMGFMQKISSTVKTQEFEYEQRMLKDWFTKNVQPVVTAQ